MDRRGGRWKNVCMNTDTNRSVVSRRKRRCQHTKRVKKWDLCSVNSLYGASVLLGVHINYHLSPRIKEQWKELNISTLSRRVSKYRKDVLLKYQEETICFIQSYSPSSVFTDCCCDYCFVARLNLHLPTSNTLLFWSDVGWHSCKVHASCLLHCVEKHDHGFRPSARTQQFRH